MKSKYKRGCILITSFLLTSVLAFGVFRELKESIAFYYTPTEIFEHKVKDRKKLKIGGLVLEGSIERQQDGLHFVLTDGKHECPVIYSREFIPPMFSANRGAVVYGAFNDSNILIATEIFAKHDEYYSPKKLAKPDL